MDVHSSCQTFVKTHTYSGLRDLQWVTWCCCVCSPVILFSRYQFGITLSFKFHQMEKELAKIWGLEAIHHTPLVLISKKKNPPAWPLKKANICLTTCCLIKTLIPANHVTGCYCIRHWLIRERLFVFATSGWCVVESLKSRCSNTVKPLGDLSMQQQLAANSKIYTMDKNVCKPGRHQGPSAALYPSRGWDHSP